MKATMKPPATSGIRKESDRRTDPAARQRIVTRSNVPSSIGAIGIESKITCHYHKGSCRGVLKVLASFGSRGLLEG